MKALWYLTKRSFINRMKRALKKPVSYLYFVLIIAYAILIIFSFGSLAETGGIKDKRGIVYLMTVWIYFIFCSNFLSYAKMKGIIFRPSHAHLVFTAPISSKIVLLHGAILNYTVTFVADLLFSVAAFWVFDVPLTNAVLLFFFTFITETAFEAGLIVFLYSGEERFQRLIFAVRIGIFLILGAVAATAGWYLIKEGFSFASVLHFLESPILQMIPVAGWNTAAVRFIVLGGNMWTIAGTILYILLCAVMIVAAYRIKCSGEYYEDAAKFADDYKKLKEKSKKGESSFSLGKKKYRAARATYRGTGAKAIFYRQLSEYKKERFFIFGGFTLTAVIGAIVCIVFIDPAAEFPPQLPPGTVLMGVIAYMTFVSTGFLGKWGKELELPYIYLIPAPAVKKLWYATLMDHIRSLIDVTIFVVPVGIAWKIPVYQMAMIIATYVVLQANRLYIKVLGESIFGNTLGETAKQFFRMGVQGGIIGIGVVLAVVAGILNFNLLFLIVPVYSMIITVLIAALSLPRFESMEQWE